MRFIQVVRRRLLSHLLKVERDDRRERRPSCYPDSQTDFGFRGIMSYSPFQSEKTRTESKAIRQDILGCFGRDIDLAGVYNTRVGNELIRGISGECSEPLHVRLVIDNTIFP